MRFLSDEGHTLIECSDGQEALDKMDKEIALAIVDVRMEPLDGFEFIRSIRGSDYDAPVILVTGDQNPDLLNEAAKWSVAAILMKPVQKDRLIQTVARTLKARAKMGGAR